MQYRNARISALVLFVLMPVFILPHSANAVASGLKITEVMYDPSGSDSNREWIEIYNTGSASVDLAGHFFLSDGLSSSRHSLAAQSASTIVAGGYAVIVQTVDGFKADFPNYTGQIFDSSWSGLTATTGKTLAVIDSSGAALDQLTYDPSIGATNDGNSLQLNAASTWVAALPTPGAALSVQNSETTSQEDDPNDNDPDTGGETSSTGSGSTQAAPSDSQKVKIPAAKPKEPKLDLLAPKMAVAGIPVAISWSMLDPDGTKRAYGEVYIVFGDGSAYTGKPEDSFEHRYDFPGTYVVAAEYRFDKYAKKPLESSRLMITITEPSVAISGVDPSGAITLLNTGKNEADIGGWKIGQPGTSDVFIIPEGTIVLSGKMIRLPRTLTRILPGNSILALMLPSGEVAATYGDTSENSPMSVFAPLPVVAPLPIPSDTKKIISETAEVSFAALALPASSEPADNLPEETASEKHSVLPFIIGLAGIILGACFALYKWKVFDVVPKKTEDSETPTETVRIVEE